ncbi:BQ5605_C004g03094 [Microbotryum silenes-dioicae]|uniref:SAGA-associated factor 11 n=1 Tax=Microbotryum silenes-dioicae TaxID=796604 RepID=A0A2X0N3R9_9BASI|nr:BQ5605_C004g03094 [Microbotryum silenes-dioicae]
MSSESDEPTVASLASALMRTMLHELVTDIAIEEYRLAWRRRTSMQANEAQAKANAAERLLGPNGESSSSSSGAATASTSNLSRPASPFGHPSPHKKDDALYECMICGRQIGAPRFASHLSSCMGLTGRSKRTATNKAPINGKLRQVLVGFTFNKRNGTKTNSNGLKRSASLSGFNGTSKHKKAKTSSKFFFETVTAPSHPANALQAQIASIGSHPLAKTLSAPAAPPISKTASKTIVSSLSGPSNTKSTPSPSKPLPSASLTSSISPASKKPPIPLSKKPSKSTDRPESDSEEDSPD